MRDAIAVERASVEDAGLLAEVGERTFRAAFAAQSDPTEMERYVASAFAVATMTRELADRANTFFVARRNGVPVGYAKLRVRPPPEVVSDRAAIELERLYVDDVMVGRGVGAQLMRVCLDHASSGDHRTIWLGVWELNQRAMRFYRQWGFEVVGTHPFQFGDDAQTDLVMQRALE
jgi:GNAT superfamily N-acetyltransferase